MAESYYTQLGTDMHALYLTHENNIPGVTENLPVNYEGIYHMLADTCYIDPYTAAEVLTGPKPRLATELGRQILGLMEAGISFENSQSEDCCSQAEWRLLRNMSKANIEDHRKRSPIIVTQNGLPCAVVKTHGIPSIYGLTTIPEHGIVAGAFSSRPPGIDAGLLGGKQYAWQMDVAEVGVASPLRLSMFCMPAKPRQHIYGDQYERPALKVEHADVQQRAQQLLEPADPLTTLDLHYLRTRTRQVERHYPDLSNVWYSDV